MWGTCGIQLLCLCSSLGLFVISSTSDLESVTSLSSPSSSQERRLKEERRKVRKVAALTGKAFKIRKKIIKAWMWSQPIVRERALRSMAHFVPEGLVLEFSVLLWVLRMDEIWVGISEQFQLRRLDLVKRWGRQAKGAHVDPFWLGCHSPVAFKQLVEELVAWMMHQAEYAFDPVMIKKIAIVLVVKGCTHHRLLGVVSDHSVPTWFHNEIHREAVKLLILAAKVRQDCAAQAQFMLRREVESLQFRSLLVVRARF